MSYYEYRVLNIDVGKELACPPDVMAVLKCLLVLCVCVCILI